MRAFGKTAFGTGCTNSRVNNDVVTECGNGLLSYGCAVTSCAMLTCGKTAFGTGCINSRISYYVVAECGDGFLRYDGSITNRANGTVGKSCFGTGCCLTYNSFFGMTKRCVINRLANRANSGLGTRTALPNVLVELRDKFARGQRHYEYKQYRQQKNCAFCFHVFSPLDLFYDFCV